MAFLLLLDIKIKFIKFCTKFWAKQAKFLPSKCTVYSEITFRDVNQVIK